MKEERPHNVNYREHNSYKNKPLNCPFDFIFMLPLAAEWR
jgi:hypothetical protein